MPSAYSFVSWTSVDLLRSWYNYTIMRHEQKQQSYRQVLGLFTILFSLALLAVSINAQVAVNSVYTIPANFSAVLDPASEFDAGVILVAETTALQDPAYVGWKIISNPYLGSFHKISDSKWFCYFSKKTSSNCGYMPFIDGKSDGSAQYELGITAFSAPEQSLQKSVIITPGEVKLRERVREINNNCCSGNSKRRTSIYNIQSRRPFYC